MVDAAASKDPRKHPDEESLEQLANLVESASRVHTIVQDRIDELPTPNDTPARKEQLNEARVRVRTLLYQTSGMEREVQRAIEVDKAKTAKEKLAGIEARRGSIFGTGASALARRNSTARSGSITGSLSSNGRRNSLAQAEEMAALLAWVRELDLEPSVMRSLVRALRPKDRRGSGGSGAGAPSATGQSTTRSSELDHLDLKGKLALRLRWRKFRRKMRLRYQACVEAARPFTVARSLFTIYGLCLLLAGVNVMLPEAFLSLNNDDNRLWARIAMLAAYVDLFVMQPLMVMMRLCCGGKRNKGAGSSSRGARASSPRRSSPSPPGSPYGKRPSSPPSASEQRRASLFLSSEAFDSAEKLFVEEKKRQSKADEAREKGLALDKVKPMDFNRLQSVLGSSRVQKAPYVV